MKSFLLVFTFLCQRSQNFCRNILNYIIISLVFQTGQRNKKFDKVIQSVDEGELSVPTVSTVINSPPGNGVIVEIPSHNGIMNDLSNSDNNETDTDIDSEGIRKRKHS